MIADLRLLTFFTALIGANAQTGIIAYGSTKGVNNNPGEPTSEVVDANLLYGVRCCADTQLPHFVAGRCGGFVSSKYPNGNCLKQPLLTLAEATSFCEVQNARVCTAAENLGDCTRTAKCGFNGVKVWSDYEYAPSMTPSILTESPSVAKTTVPSVKVTPAPSVVVTPAPTVVTTPAPTVDPNDPGGHDDPHFYTWNGALYDYHGVCDMIYTTCPNFDQGKGFHMHVRTEFVEPVKWSTISNLAVKIGDDTFEVKNNGMYYLNGEENVDLTEADLSGHKVKQSTRFDQGRLRLLFQVELNNEALLEVLIKSPKNDGTRNDRTSLSFKIKGAHDHRANEGNDFSGCVGLSSTWEEPEEGKYLVGRSGELFEFHRAHEFAPEWQVDQDKNDPMLFVEDVGLQLPNQECIKSPILVADHRHLTHLYSADGGSRGLKAENACNHLLGQEKYDACFFDVLITGDESFAEEPWYNGD